MKTDSIVYIVITLVILIISGLSGRKKKLVQMREAEAKAMQRDDKYGSGESEPAPANILESLRSAGSSVLQSSNPFERMEQILSGQDYRIQSMEGETLEETLEETVEQTVEQTVDAEEQILADIQRQNEESITDFFETESGDKYLIGDKEDAAPLSALFNNVDEIKKAVIYSEILNRKY